MQSSAGLYAAKHRSLGSGILNPQGKSNQRASSGPWPNTGIILTIDKVDFLISC